MSNLEEKILNVTLEIKDLILAKNANYGNAFQKLLDEYGAIVYIVHAFEKLYRLESLLSGRSENKFEPVRDSVIDLIGYSILYLIALNDAKE